MNLNKGISPIFWKIKTKNEIGIYWFSNLFKAKSLFEFINKDFFIVFKIANVLNVIVFTLIQNMFSD